MFHVIIQGSLRLCCIITRWALERPLPCVSAHVSDKGSFVAGRKATRTTFEMFNFSVSAHVLFKCILIFLPCVSVHVVDKV